MTATAIPNGRAKLAQIVASGLHQLAAAAADQAIRDRIAKNKMPAVNVFDEIDTLAGNLKAPYMAALAQLAGVDEFKMSIANSNADEAVTDDTDRQNTDLQGTVQHVGKLARRGATAKRGGRK